MSEEMDAPQGGAEGIEPTAVEPTSEATTEQPTGTDEPGPAPDAGEAIEEPVKKVPWFQKRIDEVTARKYEAEREAAYWRGIAEGAPRQQPAQQQAQVPDRWEDPDGYDQWLIEQATQRAIAQTTQVQKQQQAFRSYEERENSVRQAKPDYDTVVRDPTLPITPLMAEVIRESDVGPQVAYHLGTNRQEAARIASLSPPRQAAELGRIEAAFSKAPAASQKPIPPAPPQTVGGLSSGLSKSMNEMSYTEFVAMREAEEKTRK